MSELLFPELRLTARILLLSLHAEAFICYLDGGQDLLHVIVGSRDYMCGDQLAESGSCCASALYCRFNSAYVAAYHYCYQSGTDLLCSYKNNVSCLAHLVCCLDCCCKSSGFHHS